MALISPVYPAGRIDKQPAQVRVIRNSGYAYGRIVLKDGSNYDVFTNKDWYEHSDQDAAAGFVRAARRKKITAIRWEDPFFPGINDDGTQCVTKT